MKSTTLRQRLSAITQSDRAIRVLLLLALVLTGIVRLAWFKVDGNHDLAGDERSYNSVAINLINGRGFSWNGDEPTATWGPLYPGLVAAMYMAFGQNPEPVYILNIVLAVLTGYLIYGIGCILISSRFLSALAVAVMALYFPLVQDSVKLLTEVPFTFLLAATLFLTLRTLQKQRVRDFFGIGIVAGVAALCRPIMIVMPALLFFVLLLCYRPNKRLIITGTALLSLGMALLITPWTIRNYMVFHELVPISSAGGVVFYAGNYEGQWGAPGCTWPPHIQKFMDTNPSEAEVSKFLTRETVKDIKADPPRSVRLAGLKFLRFWFNLGFPVPPSRASIALAFGHLILLLLALFSVKQIRNKAALALVGSVIISFTLVHVVTFGCVRYALPLIPYVVLLATRGMAGLFPSFVVLDG